MKHCFPCLVVAALLVPSTSDAGLHLGMKSACKRYGQAWNCGSKSALSGVCTHDFYEQWRRMPGDSFAKLPRGGSGQVVSSSKGCGCGHVTVSTSHGVITFSLVGGGFHWTVADIYKAGDDGATISLKSYLDATLTAREFMKDLKEVGGVAFHDSISRRFRAEFEKLAADDSGRIRKFLPDVTKAPKPYVKLGDKTATVRVRIPDMGPKDVITFHMVRDSGWKVDDFAVDTASTKIASFRRSLPIIAGISAFGEFVNHPRQIDPESFTTAGELRAALLEARAQDPFPLTASGKREEFVVADDFLSVRVRYPDKQVQVHFDDRSGRLAIAKAEVDVGGNWADVAGLLQVRSRLSNITSLFGGGKIVDSAEKVEEPKFTGIAARETFPGSVEPSADKGAAAVVPNPDSTVALQATPKAEPPASLVPTVAETTAEPKTQPVIQQVEYLETPCRSYYPVRRGLFRGGCRRW